MYGAIWRAIPAPWPVKVLAMLAMAAVVLFAMVAWVYPWVDTLLPDLLPEGDLGVTSTNPTP